MKTTRGHPIRESYLNGKNRQNEVCTIRQFYKLSCHNCEYYKECKRRIKNEI